KGRGAVFAFLLLLVPLGAAIVSEAPPNQYVDSSSHQNYVWLFWSGIAACLAPLAWLSAVVFWAWLRKGGKPLREVVANILGLLAQKETEVTKTQTVETPDPTSVEFLDVFEELAADALCDGHQLLIVVDNLDRVGAADALKLWATL